MTKIKRCLPLLAGCLGLVLGFTGITVLAEEENKQLDVMFLHDTHSHLESFTTVADGEDQLVGGFAKLKTLMNEQLNKNEDTLLVDAGDFSMGTLVQTVFETEAAELRMLGELGIEATTLGNHEFDYRTEGLANMLLTAVESGDPLPEMLISNIDWETMETAGLTEEQQKIKDAFETYGVKEYTIIQKGDVKIALMGIFGEDCLDCAPTCVLAFRDASEAVQEVIDEIKEKESDVDMFICLSHSGTWEEEEKSEDEILAKNVPELDLIISGHTHTTLEEPIQHGDTYIVSCGEYGKKLGSLSMVETADGIWSMESYELISVEDKIEEDLETKEKIDYFVNLINDQYLEQFGYAKEQILANNDIGFTSLDDISTVHEEHNLGSIMADSYIYAIENMPDFDGDTVDVAVVPSGVIRDTYAKGDITVENVFNSFSLGMGADGIPGYPLVETYLTGAELKMVAEIDASISDLMTTARLYMAGLQFTYNPNRMILNRVTECYLVRNGERIEIENDKLYHVAADLYSAQMLGSVTDMSYGLLSIVPKFEDGTPVEDFEDIIIYSEGKEVKAWAAIAQYMSSFEDTDGDGIGNVPETYAEHQGRKEVEDSKNIIDLVKNPNKYAIMIVGIILAVILLVVVLAVIVIRVVKKGKNKRK